MPWQRGDASLEVELSRLQSWVETNDPILNGRNGEDGVIREWHDFKAQMKLLITIIGIMAAVPAVLVSLSALGVVHLR